MPDVRPTWAPSLPAALLLLAPFDLLASLAMDIYLPVVPAMPAALGTSPAIVQLTLSLYLLGLGLGQVVFGPVSDRIGRRPVLLGGAAVFAIASAGLALSASAPVFVAFRLLQSLGAAAALVATFATVRDVYAERPESVAIYGLLGSMLACVPALAPIPGAVLAGALGWRALFWLLALAALPPLVHAARRWHETRPPTAGARSVMPILRSGDFWTYTFAFGAAMGTFFVFFSTAPRVLIGGAGYSGLRFGLAFSTVALVMLATARVARRLVGRWGVAGSVRHGMALLLAGAAVLALASATGAPSFARFVLPAWILAAGIALTVSVSANGALAAFGDRAGSAVALYFCGQSLIVSILGTAAVVCLDGDTALPLAVYAAATASCVLAALRPRRGRS